MFFSAFSMTPIFAHDRISDEYEPGFEVSQAIYLAIDACKADGCDIHGSQMIVRKKKDGIEIVFLGRTPDAKQLFSGEYDHVTERHYLVEKTGTAILRKWYGK
jgi:hypothetical protein